MLKAREDAIVTVVNRLLAEKGYDLMTVDEVAAEVGIAKASLYRHFSSKEALAAAAMAAVLARAMEFVASVRVQGDTSALDRLRAVVRWALQQQLAGEMPALPAQNSALRAALVGDVHYMSRLVDITDRLGTWITQAQAEGSINPQLPPEVVLYTLFARACDPVPAALKASGLHTDAQIIDWVLCCCFDGLAAR